LPWHSPYLFDGGADLGLREGGQGVADYQSDPPVRFGLAESGQRDDLAGCIYARDGAPLPWVNSKKYLFHF
jgi:hypothetical protein